MSRSERIRLIAPADDGVQVSLTDHAFVPVATGTGGLEADVRPGLYTVRYVAGATAHQELVSVAPGAGEVVVPRPALDFRSPAPMGAAPEAHLQAAQRISGRVDAELGTGAQLFVFVRDRDRRGRRSPLTGLTLHDATGEHLLDLERACSSVASTAPGTEEPLWAGVTVALTPGPYRLRVRTGTIGTLEQLVFAAGGWQTQLFCGRRTYGRGEGGRSADLSDASVRMARLGVAFDPLRPDLHLTELARQSLGTGRAVIDAEQLQSMLWMKADNPILAIYGAHVWLGQHDARRPKGELGAVADNLAALVPGHPDVDALRLAVDPAAPVAFPLPPMLRASWQVVIAASAQRPELVPPDSLAATVAGSVYDTSTWLIWRAPRTRHPPRAARRPVAEGASVVTLMSALVAQVPVQGSARRKALAKLAPVQRDLVNFAAASATSAAEGPDEQAVLKAMGVPKTVAQANLLDVADRLDVSLE